MIPLLYTSDTVREYRRCNHQHTVRTLFFLFGGPAAVCPLKSPLPTRKRKGKVRRLAASFSPSALRHLLELSLSSLCPPLAVVSFVVLSVVSTTIAI
jgi:hypothetical protein